VFSRRENRQIEGVTSGERKLLRGELPDLTLKGKLRNRGQEKEEDGILGEKKGSF